MIRNEDIGNEISFIESSLQNVSAELEKLKKSVPQNAKLRAARHRKGYQYFIKKQGGDDNGAYIKKDDKNIAVILAQIEYDEKLIVELKNALKTLVKFKTEWINNPFVTALNEMVPGKRILVKSPYIIDESYIINWQNQQYERLSFRDDYPEYYTRQGLRVRSKSELIIADVLDEMSIPFLYERPLQLKNRIVHPDFTLLNIRERREIFWEHFGMMDDMDYRNNTFFKIRNYESNGFYLHDSLIWTFETEKYPLNTKEIRNMVQGLKKKLGYEKNYITEVKNHDTTEMKNHDTGNI